MRGTVLMGSGVPDSSGVIRYTMTMYEAFNIKDAIRMLENALEILEATNV